MATVMGAGRAVARSDRWFYVGMAAMFVAIAFGGFAPTYWAKVASGSFSGNPVLHVHGLLFFSWTLLYFTKTWLVANGRTPAHRSLGMLGIALVSGMAFTIVWAAINEVRVFEAQGFSAAARRFIVVPLTSMPFMLGFFALAIANIRRADVHKRLMIMTMIPLMQAAIARLFLTFASPPGAVGPPPVIVSYAPGLVALLLVVVAMVHDRRTLGHVHKVYWIAAPLLAAQMLLTVPISSTAGWMRFTYAVTALAGT